MTSQEFEQHWQKAIAVVGLTFLTLRYWGKVVRLAKNTGETVLYPFTAIRELAESIKSLTVAVETVQTKMCEQTDIITRISHESEIARYKANYLLEECPIGTFECTLPNGKCVYVNRSLCRLFGLSPAEMMDFGWMASIHPDDRERVAHTWEDACQTQRPYACRYRIAKGDGWLTVVATGKIVRASDGTAISFLGTVVPLPIIKEETSPTII